MFADQDFAFVNPAIGLGAASLDTFAHKFDLFFIAVHSDRAGAVLGIPELWVGQACEGFFELDNVWSELTRFAWSRFFLRGSAL